MHKRHAFSLVELSIVLVILGLLTGGILAGQSLIRAAELRAVNTEYSRYVAATQTFRDKYFGIPGDFRDATRFWKQQTSTADCPSYSSAGVGTPGACDGDGDGLWGEINGTGPVGEGHQFWRQLAHAGLIEGNYSGVSAGFAPILGTTMPASKLGKGGWFARDQGSNFTGDSFAYRGNYGNVFLLGAPGSGSVPRNAVLKPEEAWNIDTKMDDGKPATGDIIALGGSDTGAWGTATSCTTSANNNDKTGEYRFTNSALACGLFFLHFL